MTSLAVAVAGGAGGIELASGAGPSLALRSDRRTGPHRAQTGTGRFRAQEPAHGGPQLPGGATRRRGRGVDSR